MLFRKGKTKPLELLEKDTTGDFVTFFIKLGQAHQDVDIDVASEFVCRMYAQSKTKDVNEARYNKIMQMTGKVDQVGYFQRMCKIFKFCSEGIL